MQRFVGFFSWLYFSDADWLSRQTLITWIKVESCCSSDWTVTSALLIYRGSSHQQWLTSCQITVYWRKHLGLQWRCAPRLGVQYSIACPNTMIGAIHSRPYFVFVSWIGRPIHKTKKIWPSVVQIGPLFENGVPQKQAVRTFDVCLAPLKNCPPDIVRPHSAQLMIDTFILSINFEKYGPVRYGPYWLETRELAVLFESFQILESRAGQC